MAVAVLGGLVGIFIAYAKYIKKSEVPEPDENITGFAKVLYNKYYVDEIYNTLFVKPLHAMSRFFRDVLETALSSFVYGWGRLANSIGTQGQAMQNGSIGYYLFAFVLGVCSILTYLFLAQ
jgi:NADH-quinone oxidoreductase subunit L